jgi:hypothetical protein
MSTEEEDRYWRLELRLLEEKRRRLLAANLEKEKQEQ